MEPNAFAISQMPIYGRTGLKEHETDVLNIYLAAIIAKQEDDLSHEYIRCAINWCQMEFINLLSCGIVLDRQPYE